RVEPGGVDLVRRDQFQFLTDHVAQRGEDPPRGGDLVHVLRCRLADCGWGFGNPQWHRTHLPGRMTNQPAAAVRITFMAWSSSCGSSFPCPGTRSRACCRERPTARTTGPPRGRTRR